MKGKWFIEILDVFSLKLILISNMYIYTSRFLALGNSMTIMTYSYTLGTLEVQNIMC